MEDDRLLRWWLAMTLGQQGFEVVAPACVEEFLSIVSDEKFDVLVTDCNLSDCSDGFEVLASVRERNPGIFSILVSARTESDLAERAQEAGFSAFLPKPVGAVEIAAAISGQRSAVSNQQPAADAAEF
jgi:DNA-binding NtrC family response regulator